MLISGMCMPREGQREGEPPPAADTELFQRMRRDLLARQSIDGPHLEPLQVCCLQRMSLLTSQSHVHKTAQLHLLAQQP